MQKRVQISLLKSLWKQPCQSRPKPTSTYASNSVLITKPYSTQLDPDSFPSSKLNYSNSLTLQKPHFTNSFQTPRNYSTTGSRKEVDINKEVDMINLKFAEAREELEMAMESKETVYFNEEAECARDAVKQVLDMFEGLLGKVKESEKEALQRSMGLKIEQLKAELQQLDE